MGLMRFERSLIMKTQFELQLFLLSSNAQTFLENIGKVIKIIFTLKPKENFFHFNRNDFQRNSIIRLL